MAKRILIVDDEKDLTKVLEARLKTFGFEALVCTDSQQAKEKILTCHPDLVIIDIMMPHVPGHELAADIKKDPLTASIPIIFLSALVSKEEERGAYSSQGHVMMAKPYEINHLVGKIKELLKMS